MGYPPGAEHSRHAPYNQRFTQGACLNEVVDVVTDAECNDFECTVKYWFEQYEMHVQIGSYEVKIRKTHNIPDDILDEQVRDIIREQFNEHTQIEFV